MSEWKAQLQEKRLFNPPKDYSATSLFKNLSDYEKEYQQAEDHFEEFWQDKAESLLHWHKKPTKTLTWDPPFARWLEDGLINLSFNCLDRHLEKRAQQKALIWEGEPGEVRTFTYAELHLEVCRFANVLLARGVKAGDRVSIYLPLIPEVAIAMLACTRIGATHNVVFAGFSAEALAERNNDSQASVVITADGSWRKGQVVHLKQQVDAALEKSPTVKTAIVVKRLNQDVLMKSGRDFFWDDLMKEASDQHKAEGFPAEQPLFILYTSGSTGKPKGVLHTTGGYILSATYSSKIVFDFDGKDPEKKLFWCTADVGWITGHSYVVYGALSNGATSFMYEGALNHPDPGRIWQMVEKHRIHTLYTAPTAIRTFIKSGDEWPERYDLSSLRLLGSVGEPINPEAWMWYHRKIGKERCPIVDTWFQTETGCIMISPLPGAIATKPGTATRPLPGVILDVVDKQGKAVPNNTGGFLVIKKPWPSMLRTIYGNTERYNEQYWSQIPGCYFAGDSARRDEDGYIWILGRVDDVLNVSGHRLSTMELESTLVSHPSVAEAAVVGIPHDVKGEGIVCFVTLKASEKVSDSLKKDLTQHIVKNIGALARPEEIRFAESLPKTRSGKIIRRLLRDVANGRAPSGDTSTLEDFSALAALEKDE